MSEFLFKCYGTIHHTVKKLLKRAIPGSGSKLFSVYDINNLPAAASNAKINGEQYSKDSKLFCGENACDKDFPSEKCPRGIAGDSFSDAESAWKGFINNAQIPAGWMNSGFCQCAFIKEKNNWALSSWIWTSAAVARYFALAGNAAGCTGIADAFLREQLPEGGWIVRYDFPDSKLVQSVAPNDSAYIAANALLPAYKLTGSQKYLDAAQKCADWIIKTARPDSMVWIAFDKLTGQWKKKSNIVDTGFTAALFSRLYEITRRKEYLDFLESFINKYIDLFYDPQQKLFHTSLDENDNPCGGYFARGQGWALEGLIPAYEVLKTDALRKIISDCTGSLIKYQSKDGGWSYNFAHTLMGQDCKGVPVIAYSLMKWNEIFPDKRLVESAERAIEWSKKHTRLSGNGAGGIFCYSTEGAVVHDLYTETAFVYASAYSLETLEFIRGQK